MNKYFHAIFAFLLGLVLGVELVVLMFTPDWVQPEGIAAGAIWGGIVLFAMMVALPTGVAIGGVVLFLDVQYRKRIIIAESGLILVATLIILVVVGR